MEPGKEAATTSVVKVEPPVVSHCGGAAARKLRKQKMASVRAAAARASSSTEKTTSRERVSHGVSEEALPPKKRRFVSADPVEVKQEETPLEESCTISPSIEEKVQDTASHKKAKKLKTTNKSEKGATQMRYEPDVPMSKEEVSAWRKEQRKVRNRESAAASRQKTRKRITELEAALEEWKAKYEHVSKQLRELQEKTGRTRSASDCSEDMQEVVYSSDRLNKVEGTGVVSPSSSPPSSPEPWSGEAPPSVMIETQGQNEPQAEQENTQHLIETISRPA